MLTWAVCWLLAKGTVKSIPGLMWVLAMFCDTIMVVSFAIALESKFQ